MRYCWLLLMTLIYSCTSAPLPEEINQEITELKNKYAPDKRVAIFNVIARKNGPDIILSGETNFPEAKTELIERLQAIVPQLVDSIVVLPAADLEGQIYGVINLSVANIRSNPKHSAELATQATLGTPLRVYKKKEGWYLVQTPDGYLGWLDPGGLMLMNEAAYAEWMAAPKVIFQPDYGFSYKAPASDQNRVSDLISGNILINQGQEANYTKVAYPDGRTAFIDNNMVLDYPQWLNSRDPSLDNILSSAFDLMGRPYLWGGTSGKGMDCSGFTKTVFYLNGLIFPRDASQQVHTGIEVPTDTTLHSLEPGDLLFFGRKATAEKKERIWHVAIYLGEGKIIHSAGTVKVESLRRSDPDFAEDRLLTLVRAKRMLNSIGQNGVILMNKSPFYRPQNS